MNNKTQSQPCHVAIIMDGNGRWANQRNLPRNLGHKQGGEALNKIVAHCQKLGIKYLTVYAFSTENWSRPKDEVEGIMNLLRDYIKQAEKKQQENVRLRFLGDKTMLAEDLQQSIEKIEEKSRYNDGLCFSIALNYGGRQEITTATQKIAQMVQKGELAPQDITEELIAKSLYTTDMPDPDLIIRPSGEQRLSNFLLWQSAYTEFVFMDVLWPDFTPKCFDEAISEFSKRNRRFGGI